MPVPTPHIEAKKGEIARNVLMPGDPLRAKYVAEHFLEDARLVNQVRNVYAYTGTYKGKELTVMASGMGMPSIGIYSYELYKFYDVDNIIRIGSAGAYTDRLAVYDVVLADSAWSQSSFAKVQNGCMDDVLYPSESLNTRILDAAHCLQIPLKTARIHSSDVFYTEDNVDGYKEIIKKHQCECVEMESFALFHNAKLLGKNAACLLTISDSFVTHEELSSLARQESFENMMKIALEACCSGRSSVLFNQTIKRKQIEPAKADQSIDDSGKQTHTSKKKSHKIQVEKTNQSPVDGTDYSECQ